MRSVTPTARAVAKTAASAFGARDPQVHAYYDEDESHRVDVMECSDCPTAGFTTYSTLTLHETPNLLDERDVRVELAGVAATSQTAFSNLIATAAFYVMKQGWLAAPGVVFPNLLNEYDFSPSLDHVLWVQPFPWEELGCVDVGAARTVSWLLAIPISAAEHRLLLEKGYDSLEARFAEHELEYFDLSRPSIA
jgi:antitoxin YqcF